MYMYMYLNPALWKRCMGTYSMQSCCHLMSLLYLLPSLAGPLTRPMVSLFGPPLPWSAQHMHSAMESHHIILMWFSKTWTSLNGLVVQCSGTKKQDNVSASVTNFYCRHAGTSNHFLQQPIHAHSDHITTTRLDMVSDETIKNIPKCPPSLS